MSHTTPRVSIGLPVYNGEAFLQAAVESLLGQSYRELELVICDNASTDATESMCRAWAAADPRVRYYRNEENIGAMHNFNRVFGLARGELFKWAAHDDVHEPDYIARCVQALDERPHTVLAFPRSRDIDESGRTLKVVGFGLEVDSPSPSRRFKALIRREHSCVPIFGVMRADVLRRTRLLADYADCDRVLLAEIGLAGPFVELSDALFYHRQHRNRSVWQYRSRQTRSAWFDPAKAGRPVFPYTRQLVGYLGAIRRAPIGPRDRAACTRHMLGWIRHHADGLVEDVTFALRFALRPLKRRLVPESRAVDGTRGGER